MMKPRPPRLERSIKEGSAGTEIPPMSQPAGTLRLASPEFPRKQAYAAEAGGVKWLETLIFRPFHRLHARAGSYRSSCPGCIPGAAGRAARFRARIAPWRDVKLTKV